MGLWKDKTRGDWRYSFKHLKKVYAGGGFKTKADARAAREIRRKAVKEEKPIKTAITFSEIANQYLDWSERRHARKTYQYKSMVFREFLSHQGNIEFLSISPIVIHEYLISRPSNHNFNVHRKELCSLFSYAQRHLGIVAANPVLSVEKLPEEQKRKNIPTYQEFLKIVSAANPEEKPLILILAFTLARIDEILRLTWKDINFEHRVVTLWTRKRKGGNWEPRHIPMIDELHRILKPMWNRRLQDEWVFFHKREGTRYNRRPKMMRSICKRAGVPLYGFHTIRHFGATFLNDAQGVSVGVVSKILGHKSQRVTEEYLHTIPSSVREAMKKLGDMLAPNACTFDEK